MQKQINLSYFIEGNQLYPLIERYQTGIELTRFIDEKQLAAYESLIQETKEENKNIGYIAIHGPFQEVNAATTEPNLKEYTLKQYNNTYQLAQALQAKVIIYHGFYDAQDPLWLQTSISFWKAYLLNKADMLFVIENCYEQSPLPLIQLVDAVNSPNLQLCLDIGHAHVTELYTVNQWIEMMGHRIRYVHLHNNDGCKDLHRGLNQGTIPIDKVLENLEIHAPEAIWSLENTDLEASISVLIHLGYMK